MGAAGNLSQYFFKSQESLATVIDNEEGEQQLQSPLCSPGDPAAVAVGGGGAEGEGSGGNVTPVAEEQPKVEEKKAEEKQKSPKKKTETDV